MTAIRAQQKESVGGRESARPAGVSGLGVDIAVPTPAGYATIGTLSPGDEVFAADGNPAHITAVSAAVPRQDCWELTFSTGEKIISGTEQRWPTDDLRERLLEQRIITGHGRRPSVVAYPDGASIARTTAQIAWSQQSPAGPNHAVRLAAAVRLPDAPLRRDPFLVGATLGTRGGRSRRSREADAIPLAFLRGSVRQRSELLAGLIESRSRLGGHGEIAFTTAAPHVAWDVRELLSSLGQCPVVSVGRLRRDCWGTHREFSVVFVPNRPAYRDSDKNLRVAELADVSGVLDRHRYRHIVRVRAARPQAIRHVRAETADGGFLVTRSFIPTTSVSTPTG